ncbi:MAG: enoyl-CoA hydratase/isomerase family protein [Candidatus Eisenbacteria bacterium]|nr:enoyl-CoA hydratase/isomerase family protein [Candidatus Eisenbacteria bacterium]
MSPETVLLDVARGVAVVTLNRPEKLNAFAGDMRERLIARLDEVAGRDDVRVLVLTGAGRAFCAGGDVEHMAGLAARGAPFGELEPLLEAGERAVRRLSALPFPVIAALNGVAAGAGANLALACDVRVASAAAKFGETFVKLALHPDWGGTHHLPRLVGVAKALELCWSGDLIAADEALRLGLVQRLWPAESFEREWRAWAASLAAGPQLAVRAAKASLRAAPLRSLEECLAAERIAQSACWGSPDAAEGVRAFVEKRPAVFGAAPDGDFERTPSRASRAFE